jgi:RNA polymerase sigma factor (sigma-70 family)
MDNAPDTRASLILRLRDGRDEESWAEFVQIYSPLIYKIARRRGLQDADAADLCQDVLKSVASAIDRWDPDPAKGSFRAWLFRIARNLVINFLTRHRWPPRGSGDSDVNRVIEEAQAPPGEGSDLFDEEYALRVFHWAAEQVRDEFSAEEWQSFWWTTVDGRPAREVAGLTGKTVGMVYYYKSRIMARIRQKIEQVEGR